jgi:putative transposase
MLWVRSVHAPIFAKEKVLFVLCVLSSIKQQVCFCFHMLQERVLRWIKPPTTTLVFGTLANLTKG